MVLCAATAPPTWPDCSGTLAGYGWNHRPVSRGMGGRDRLEFAIKRLGQFILYLERSDIDLERWLADYERLIKKNPHPGPTTHPPG